MKLSLTLSQTHSFGNLKAILACFDISIYDVAKEIDSAYLEIVQQSYIFVNVSCKF